MVGPRRFSTGPGIFPDTNFQSVEEAKSIVARYKKDFRTDTRKSYMIGNRRQRQWMIAALVVGGEKGRRAEMNQ